MAVATGLALKLTKEMRDQPEPGSLLHSRGTLNVHSKLPMFSQITRVIELVSPFLDREK